MTSKGRMPLIWKERFWATPRDRRLLDRLALLPRLRDLGESFKTARSDGLLAKALKNDGAQRSSSFKTPRPTDANNY